MGQISFGGAGKEACLAFVPEAQVGDYVLVHAGFAISLLDEAEAAQTLADLRKMGELDEDPRGEEARSGLALPDPHGGPADGIHQGEGGAHRGGGGTHQGKGGGDNS
jgi:hydrogenase expression/formation protein HypC